MFVHTFCLLLVFLAVAKNVDASPVTYGSIQACGFDSSTACMLANGTGAAICNDNNANTLDLCLRMYPSNHTGTVLPGGAVCGCYHQCLTIPNCNDNDTCTLDEPVVLPNGTCGCAHSRIASPNCTLPIPTAPPCNISNSCVTANISQGYCHPTWNSSLNSATMHSGCNDCNSATMDLCLLCDHMHNGTYFCECEYIPIPNTCNSHADCDDGSICTNDFCNFITGSCYHESVVCQDGNACTSDVCDEQYGCVSYNITCDQGTACLANTCDPAIGCVATVVNCDDGLSCTDDMCDVVSGCVYTARHNLCTPNNTMYGNNTCHVSYCDASNSSHLADSHGCVQNITICDDNVACTLDICLTNNFTCIAVPKNDLCSDGFTCTDDVCQPGDPNAVGNTGCVYTENDGNCAPTPATVNTCLDLTCLIGPNIDYDPNTGCTAVANNNHCDDNIACTEDLCFINVNDVPFDYLNYYDSQTHCAHVPRDIRCDDGYSCTLDFCDFTTGCMHTADNSHSCSPPPDTCFDAHCIADLPGDYTIEPGTGCVYQPRDYNCAQDCRAGTCSSNGTCSYVVVPVRCNDTIPCTADSCDITTGVCANVPITNYCADAYACTTDICASFAYLNDAVNFNYNSPFYNATSGCFNDPSATNYCSVDDTACRHGVCVGNYITLDLSVGTTGYVQPVDNVSGCAYEYVNEACGSGLGCTDDICNVTTASCQHILHDDQCSAPNQCKIAHCNTDGTCYLTDKDCNDNDVCTTDACNIAIGVCRHTPVPNCCTTNASCSAYTPPYGACSVLVGCQSNLCVYQNRTCTSNDYCQIAMCDQNIGCTTVARTCAANTSCEIVACDSVQQKCVVDQFASDRTCTPSVLNVFNVYPCVSFHCMNTTESCPTASIPRNNITITPFSSYNPNGDAYPFDDYVLQTRSYLRPSCCVTANSNTDGCPPLTCQVAYQCTTYVNPTIQLSGTYGGCLYKPIDLNATCVPPNACQTLSCTSSATCTYTPIDGCCLTNSDCDDHNSCTTDTCQTNHTCTNIALAEGASCNSGDGCLLFSTCCNGICKGVSVVCDDSNSNTVDTCISINATAYKCESICSTATAECCADCDCPRSRPHCQAIYPNSNPALPKENHCGCADPLEYYNSVQLGLLNRSTLGINSCDDPAFTCMRYTDFVTTPIVSLGKRANPVSIGTTYAIVSSVRNVSAIFNPTKALGTCIRTPQPLLLPSIFRNSTADAVVYNTPQINRCNQTVGYITCPGGTCVKGGIAFPIGPASNLRTIKFTYDTCLASLPLGYGCFTSAAAALVPSSPVPFPSCNGGFGCAQTGAYWFCNGVAAPCTGLGDCLNTTNGTGFAICSSGSCSVLNLGASLNSQAVVCNTDGWTNFPTAVNVSCTRDSQCCVNQVCQSGTCTNALALGQPCGITTASSTQGIDRSAPCQTGLQCYKSKPSDAVSHCVQCRNDTDCGNSAQYCTNDGQCARKCVCARDCDDGDSRTDESCDTQTGRCIFRCLNNVNSANDTCCTTHRDCVDGSRLIAVDSIYGNPSVLNVSAVGWCDHDTHRCRTSCGDGRVNAFLEQCDGGANCTATCNLPFNPLPTPAPTPVPSPTPEPAATVLVIMRGNDCTTDDECSTYGDQCNAAECVLGLCYYRPRINEACNDNLKCTETDRCVIPDGAKEPVAVCVGTPRQCDAGANLCEHFVCNEAADGECVFVRENEQTCSDNNGCTVDSCDPQFGCVHEYRCTGDSEICQYVATTNEFRCIIYGGDGNLITNGTNPVNGTTAGVPAQGAAIAAGPMIVGGSELPSSDWAIIIFTVMVTIPCVIGTTWIVGRVFKKKV